MVADFIIRPVIANLRIGERSMLGRLPVEAVVCNGCFALCILSWFLLIKSLTKRKKAHVFFIRKPAID